VWLSLAPADKLVSFLEASVAAAVADRPRRPPAWGNATAESAGFERSTRDASQSTTGADPEITAVNAAFALGLVERHGLVDTDHRIYDLAHAAAQDAPGVGLDGFKRQFRTLAEDPDESTYRKALVEATRAYAAGGEQAAD
jgi:hypothetical protein